MKKIRLGIVGCGIAARELHFPALKELTDKFEIVAVTSRTREHAEDFAKLVNETLGYTPQVFSSYEELLLSKQVDAVDLTLPIELNVPFIKQAVEHNLHVICEKPISTDVKSGKELVEFSLQTNKVIYIAENYRHAFKYNKIRELLYEGAVGQPIFVDWHLWIGMDKENKYVKTTWRQVPKHIGGFLSDGGVHHVAALRVMLGDIEWVSGQVKRITDYLGDVDFLSTLFEFKTGVVGNYTVSYAVKGEEYFEIVGTEGKIRLTPSSIVLSGKVNEEIPLIQENTFKKEFEDFYEVLTTEKPNVLGNPAEALKDLAFFEAAIKSKGEKVEIERLIKDA
ncbi:Gfo/Idh/MocA family oxidoreductase [Fervidobacterium pennivorans subsp. carthaginiensis]|uniref:Gfo/Idh/MocA family protein n=1 Tax=Fervidobacterium pennivorans TaxID=93466 RepID=UPI00355C58EE